MADEMTPRDVDDPQGFTHRFAEVNGIRKHYVEEGEGPLVVLLHGYPFLWYLWRHQVQALAAAGYRAVALDQRGYGQTDCPPDVDSYDLTHLVGDVVGLVNTLGAESAVVVGQDWGSPVAYSTALMRPDLVRGVLMMCTPPSPRSPVRPSDAMKAYADNGIVFYQSDLAQPEATDEIMPRRFRPTSASRRSTTTSASSRGPAFGLRTAGTPRSTRAGRTRPSSTARSFRSRLCF